MGEAVLEDGRESPKNEAMALTGSAVGVGRNSGPESDGLEYSVFAEGLKNEWVACILITTR